MPEGFEPPDLPPAMARFSEERLVFPARRRSFGRRRPALVVDADGAHAPDRTIRWADYAGIALDPPGDGADRLTIATGNGRPLSWARADVRCDLPRIPALVALWIEHCGPAASRGDVVDDDEPGAAAAEPEAAITDSMTDDDWRAAEAAEAPDDAWSAFGSRDDEDPLRR